MASVATDLIDLTGVELRSLGPDQIHLETAK